MIFEEKNQETANIRKFKEKSSKQPPEKIFLWKIYAVNGLFLRINGKFRSLMTISEKTRGNF